MRVRSLVLAAAVSWLSLLAAPAMAQSVDASDTDPDKSAQGDVSVTIYNGNLGLVQDVREMTIPSGQSRQEFPDVSAQIRPETVSFAAQNTEIVEQNFDFDLLTPAKLMEKAVGETITIIRTNPATGSETRQRAKVLSVNNGVVLEIDGHVEVMRDDGLPVRAIFDQVPENLRARPTLSITLDSSRSGRRAASLRYLTPGLGWSADYVSLYDEKAGMIDVQGWVTLTNTTGTTYRDANTLLVAGEVGEGNQQNNYNRRNNRYNGPQPAKMVMAGTETSGREQLGDYYLYPLAERTTIADRQTKQVSFLDVQAVPAQKVYQYSVGWLDNMEEPASASSAIAFSTSRAGGLGDALPAGTVRFYQKDGRGNPQFIGESEIDHTPMGSRLSLITGEAFDVKVKAVNTSREELTALQWEASARFRITQDNGDTRTTTYVLERPKTFYRSTMVYTVTNARSEPVTVDLRQNGLYPYWWAYDTRVVSETLANGGTLKGEQVNADTRLYKVPVAANGTTVLTVVYDTHY